MVEVALFPIPNMVAFPGTTVPLHVFEPRYRQLVSEAVEHERMVAVSHVEKALHTPRQNEKQSVEQALQSNQTTYKSHEVFSAGLCEVVETLADGRILAVINMTERLSLQDDVQQLPYRIVRCLPYADQSEPELAAQNALLQQAIGRRLADLVRSEHPELATELSQQAWTELSAELYSFKIFELLRIDPAQMQQVLESRSAHQRLKLISTALGL